MHELDCAFMHELFWFHVFDSSLYKVYVVDKFKICFLGLQFVKQLCVSDFNSVVMELTSK